MLSCPFDGGFLDGVPDSLKQIQVFLAALGQEIHSPRLQGSGVVTSHKDGALGNPMVVAEAVDQGDNGIKTCQLTAVGVSFFDGARDSVVTHNSVGRVHTFNDKCGSTKSVAQGAITHGHSCTGAECCGQSPTVICDLCMLHCPVARAGKGFKGFIQRGRGRPFHLGGNETFSEQSEGVAGNSDRDPNAGGRGNVRRGPIKGETTLLVMSRQGLPFPPCQVRVPFKDVPRSGV